MGGELPLLPPISPVPALPPTESPPTPLLPDCPALPAEVPPFVAVAPLAAVPPFAVVPPLAVLPPLELPAPVDWLCPPQLTAASGKRPASNQRSSLKRCGFRGSHAGTLISKKSTRRDPSNQDLPEAREPAMCRPSMRNVDLSSLATRGDSGRVAVVAVGRRDSGNLILLVCFALVVVACWLSFKRIVDWYFIDVDTFPLISTGRVRSWQELGRVLSRPLMQGQMPNARFFRPVASLSWGIDQRLWGLRAFGYHLTDLALHTANACLLLTVTRAAWLRLAPKAPADTECARSDTEANAVALGSALLFALSPAQSEFLPAIARRPDLLAGFFGLLTLNGTLGLLRRPTGRPSALCALWCFLGLASKETAIVIPISAGLLVALSSHERSWAALLRRSLVRTWPLGSATLIYLAWRLVVLHGLGGYAPMRGEPNWWMGFLRSLGTQFLLFVAPAHLNRASAALNFLGSYWTAPLVIALVALVVHCVRVLQRGAIADRFFLWLVGSSLTLVVLPLVAGTMVPRQMYLHTMFFAIAFAWMGTRLARAARLALKRGRTMTGVLRTLPYALALACTVDAVARSPIFGFDEGLERWRRTGEISSRVLRGSLPLLAALPPNATVFLVDFPYTLDFGDDPNGLPQPETVILLEHSVQGWVDLQFPDKQLDVIGLTYLGLGTAGPKGLSARVAFEREARLLDVQIARGAVVSLFPWTNAYGRHRYPQVFRFAFERPTPARKALGIRLQLAERYLRGPVVFLIYTGAGVTLRTLASFALES